MCVYTPFCYCTLVYYVTTRYNSYLMMMDKNVKKIIYYIMMVIYNMNICIRIYIYEYINFTLPVLSNMLNTQSQE